MITKNTDYSIQRLRGLSTDTKPTDVPNGSEFREMDTGKKFLFSAAGTEWIEQPSSGGGSGGGGSVAMKVTFDTPPDGPVTADKTFAEVSAAVQDGRYVYAVRSGAPDIYQLASVSEEGIDFSRFFIGIFETTAVAQDILYLDSNNVAGLSTVRYPS